MRSRYPGTCVGGPSACGGTYKVDDEIWYAGRGKTFHWACKPPEAAALRGLCQRDESTREAEQGSSPAGHPLQPRATGASCPHCNKELFIGTLPF